MPRRNLFLVPSLFLVAAANAQPREPIRLYPASAPGSETWTQIEKQYFSKVWNTEVVTNVVSPTLTYFAADPKLASGASVIICPGGGFHALSISSEGVDVAKWLSARGVASFVLKYRLVKTGEDGTKEVTAKIQNRTIDAANAELIPLAIADSFAALKYVRQHAADFGISPDKIGFMGFSAGGTLTAAVAFQYSTETRPAFLAPIYPYLGALKDSSVPADAPPMFIAAATDDQLGLAPDAVRLYGKWLAARKNVELHMYSKGGHGFGMRTQGSPSDHWIDRFGDWLILQGFATRP